MTDHVDHRVQGRVGAHLATWEIDVSTSTSHQVRMALYLALERPHTQTREVRILIRSYLMRIAP